MPRLHRSSAIAAPLALLALLALASFRRTGDFPVTSAPSAPATANEEADGAPGDAAREDGADAPGLPERGVAESWEAADRVAPKQLDRAKLEARGRKAKALESKELRGAATFNDETWTGRLRDELVAWLRGARLVVSASFTEADVRTVARLQAGSGADVDGKVRPETMAVFLAAGFRFSTLPQAEGSAELVFFSGELEDLAVWKDEIAQKVEKEGLGFRDIEVPTGEGRIYAWLGGRVVASFRARGGPPSDIDDVNGHVASPTRPGTYKLGAAHPHVTSNWFHSQLPWGAQIRKVGSGFQYRWPGYVAWSWATGSASKLKEPFDAEDFDDLPTAVVGGEKVWVWNKNDFGPKAWNLVRSDLYVHTAPDDEAASARGDAVTLSASHGCVRIVPRERDEMIERGWLRKDIRFVVREMTEHLLPDRARRQALDDASVGHIASVARDR